VLATTSVARANLEAEGIDAGTIVVTGNTVVDALQWAVAQPVTFADPLVEKLGGERDLVLVTTHRREAWGDRMLAAMRGLGEVARNHPELSATYPDRPTITSTAADPVVLEHWNACEAAGLPSQFNISPDGQVRASRVPLLGSAVSFTMSGQAACRKPLSDAIDANLSVGTLLLFHYPGTWNHILRDHAVTFRVLPLGPTQTQLTTKWLVHRDAVAGVDYDVNELTRVWLATNDQDRHIVQENQIGMNAPLYEPGPYSEVTENGVRQFADWYSTRMQQRLQAEQLTDVA